MNKLLLLKLIIKLLFSLFTDINECAHFNGKCEHDCHNTDGDSYCTCQDGFDLVKGFMCEGKLFLYSDYLIYKE